MTEDELQELVESWDIHEYEENSSEPAADPEDFIKRKEHEGRYHSMLRELLFLEKHFFKEYHLNRPRDFMAILRDWLEQFDKNDTVLNPEKRYAFNLAYKIIFFSRDQILSLLDVVWDKIKKGLLRIAAEERNNPLSNLIFDKGLMEKQLENSIFVPLSDSSHLMEFRHHCLPEGKSESLIIPSIDKLYSPLKEKNSDQIEEIKKLYKAKNNLFIIEDFSGSGTTN